MSKGSRVKLCRHGNRQFHSLGMAMRRAPARSARAAIGGNRPCWGHCCATCASGSACCGNRRYRDSCCGDIDDHINDVVVIIVAIQCCGHGCWINLDRDRWVIVIVRVFDHHGRGRCPNRDGNIRRGCTRADAATVRIS